MDDLHYLWTATAELGRLALNLALWLLLANLAGVTALALYLKLTGRWDEPRQ